MPQKALSPLKLALVIPSLESGGAERVLSIMANHWSREGGVVTVITRASAKLDFFPLDERVRRVALDSGGARGGTAGVLFGLREVAALRSALAEADPDVVISFITSTNILTLMAQAGSSTPTVVSERVDPRSIRLPLVPRTLRRLLYRRAAAVVGQTERVARWAERVVPPGRVVVIPNPVVVLGPASPAFESVEPEMPRPFVVGVGRLVPQKGYDVLLRAFARCVRRHPEWSLVIVGEGEDRPRLDALALELGISSRLLLPGTVRDTAAVLRQASLFVLSSRFEGFPNALLEAMAHGLPVIATDCPTGPREIIRPGKDGVLVPPDDVGALANAMERLMVDEGERARLASLAPEVSVRFGADVVMARWNVLLHALLAGSRR